MTIQEYLQTAGLVLASGNQHKLTEFRRILLPRGIELIGANELGLDLDVPETEPTFRGNAALKARAYFQHAQRPVIADDSGLVVDALDGAPGVYSARYGGPDLDDAGRRRFLLSELERVGVRGEARSARFVCVLALYLPARDAASHSQLHSDSRSQSNRDPKSHDDLFFFEGLCEGYITDRERGSGGFGYDPVFLDPQSGRSFSELSPAEKDARSHRGRALAAFLDGLSVALS